MKLAVAAALCMLMLFDLAGCAADREPAVGLFSWKDAADGEVFETARQVQVTEIYQHFSRDFSKEDILAFLEEARENGMGVYHLVGEPEWGLDPSGKAMVEEIRQTGRLSGFQGVVLDVEPYLTDEWDEDADGTMERYVSAMERAYEEARRRNLRCIICIPYFYDTKGQSELLERLIAECCDAVAVMNYQKADECGQIAFEAEAAGRYGKDLYQIYELQQPGEHDLTERNTYGRDGFGAVEASQAALREEYPEIRFAYHEYRSLKEMLSDE